MTENEHFLNEMGLEDVLSHYNGMRLFLNGLVEHLCHLVKTEKLDNVEDLQVYKCNQYRELCEFINESFKEKVENAPPYQPEENKRRLSMG